MYIDDLIGEVMSLTVKLLLIAIGTLMGIFQYSSSIHDPRFQMTLTREQFLLFAVPSLIVPFAFSLLLVPSEMFELKRCDARPASLNERFNQILARLRLLSISAWLSVSWGLAIVLCSHFNGDGRRNITIFGLFALSFGIGMLLRITYANRTRSEMG